MFIRFTSWAIQIFFLIYECPKMKRVNKKKVKEYLFILINKWSENESLILNNWLKCISMYLDLKYLYLCKKDYFRIKKTNSFEEQHPLREGAPEHQIRWFPVDREEMRRAFLAITIVIGYNMGEMKTIVFFICWSLTCSFVMPLRKHHIYNITPNVSKCTPYWY